MHPEIPPPPSPSEQWVGKVPSDGAVATGRAYTDGALRGTIPWASRAGWAFVVDDGIGPSWGKYGVCAEAYTSVLRAELRAVFEVLRVTIGPIEIHVDNKMVVDGVAHGRAWCCDARREAADLWREVWDRLDEMPGLVQVVKVKAHLSYEDVLSGRIPWKHWLGNGMADMWAKAGSTAAARQSPTAAIHSQWTRVVQWYKWVVAFASDWTEDTAKSGPVPPPPAEKREIRATLASVTHEVWRTPTNAWCRRCGTTGLWTPGKPPPVSFRRPCRGTMADRAGIWGREFAAHDKPVARDDGALPFGFLRSKGAEKISKDDTGTFRPEEVDHGHMSSHVATMDMDRPDLFDELPPSVAGDDPSDEDPFGHVALGMYGVGLSLPAAPVYNEPPATLDVPEACEGQEAPRRAHATHKLRRHAQVVWCQVCGRSAVSRLGIGLVGPCKGTAEGAYPARLKRLNEGLHPLTGAPL